MVRIFRSLDLERFDQGHPLQRSTGMEMEEEETLHSQALHGVGIFQQLWSGKA